MKARRIIVALLAVAGLALVGLVASRQREPSYQGKRLSEWADDLTYGELTRGDVTDSPRAAEAIRSIGANALPFLSRELMLKDTGFEELRQKLPVLSEREPNLFRRVKALRACEALGPVAQGLIPELTHVLTNTERRLRADDFPDEKHLAAEILARIDPRAKRLLVNAAISDDSWLASAAVNGLGELPAADDSVRTILRQRLADDSEHIRFGAAFALCKLGEPSEDWLPTLSKHLRLQDGSPCTYTISEISTAGPKARAVVPHLCELLGRVGADDSNDVFQAIQRIDPETARKLGL
jgi:HEAT repeat protein